MNLEKTANLILNEGISSFKYSPPKDKSQQLFDFYVLTALPLYALESSKDNFNVASLRGDAEEMVYVAKEAQEIIVNHIQKNHLSDVLFSIAAEFRHVFADNTAEKLANFAKTNGILKEFQSYVVNYKMRSSGYKEFIPRLEKIRTEYDENDKRGYLDSYKSILKSFKNIPQFVSFAEQCFLKLNWASAYGGKPWANICNGWLKLNAASSYNDKVVWIDHVYDLQHNTNTVFNKIKAYSKLGSYEWIKKALDKKRDARSLFDIVDNASPSVKLFTARIVKAAFNETLESWAKSRKPDAKQDTSASSIDWEELADEIATEFPWDGGTWEDGVWKDGIWNSGVFINGTWKNGTWKNGIWVNGMWEDGIWKDGVWENGTWVNGMWEKGVWHDGVWKGGVWKGGTWNSGTWKGGMWTDGFWKSGTWENGIWHNGIWKKGTWKDGTWNNGTWRNGSWESGTWIIGTWKTGIWKGGIWEYGFWESGTWENGIWKNGTWTAGIWENGVWIDGIWKGGVWKGGEWKGGEWKGGKILYKGKLVNSKVDPDTFFKQMKK